MADIYESHVVQNVLGRLRWLRDAWSDRLWSAVFGSVDLVITAAKNATKAGFASETPVDGIEYHARARLLERLSWEGLEDLRLRALDSWDFWPAVTNAAGLRDVLRLYSQAATLEIYDEAVDGWVSGGTGSTDDDADPDNASRHTVVIPQAHSWSVPTVGPGLVVGPDLVVGITMTGTELRRIRGGYRRHRPANMVGWDIWVLFDATTAAALLANHEASSDFVRLPLHRQMVGNAHHGMVVGPSMKVGVEFT